MEFIIAESTEDMSRRAADRIASFVEADPACVLGLATGTTPIGLYACLVDDCAQGKISFADVTTFNLDEYRGLNPEHDQSYRYFMKKHLFDHVDIDQARTHVPEGSNPDAEAVCAVYEQAIEEAGGIEAACEALGRRFRLTPRERDVFLLLARGRNRAFICEELVIGDETVKSHVKSIYRKVDVHSQQSLIDLIEAEARNA